MTQEEFEARLVALGIKQSTDKKSFLIRDQGGSRDLYRKFLKWTRSKGLHAVPYDQFISEMVSKGGWIIVHSTEKKNGHYDHYMVLPGEEKNI